MSEIESVLAGLRAAAEPTRLRLLVLCARTELTVGELAHILGQSQPRVSRHLKLLCGAGLLDRFREGASVFYRLAERGTMGQLAERVLDLLPAGDSALALDRERLEAVKRARDEAAQRYFRDNAARWDELRSLYVDESEVERELVAMLPANGVRDLLDIGTGTGRMLQLFGPRVERAIGVDLSREMLALARAALERARLKNCIVRQADMYKLPFPAESFDAVTVHQVLHFADQPAQAIGEAARVLRRGGILMIADFAPHELEHLRRDHAHRRLGFADEEIAGWCRRAGIKPADAVHLPGRPLTVTVWRAARAARPVGRVVPEAKLLETGP
ncbi:MAG: ArsR/SmtB family transcription factor [Alphaproteobacteria bacterium]